MSTLLGIVAKLPPRHGRAARPRIQLQVGWANVLFAASGADRGGPDPVSARRSTTRGCRSPNAADLRPQADVLKSVVEIFAEPRRHGGRTDQRCARPSGDPATAGRRAAANVATIAATSIASTTQPRGAVQQWATPLSRAHGPVRRNLRPLHGGHRGQGAARTSLRRWIPSARRTRPQPRRSARTRTAARLAGTLLGELLCDTGENDEAARLLDESYALGSRWRRCSTS